MNHVTSVRMYCACPSVFRAVALCCTVDTGAEAVSLRGPTRYESLAVQYCTTKPCFIVRTSMHGQCFVYAMTDSENSDIAGLWRFLTC